MKKKKNNRIFSKAVVVWCVIMGTLASFWALRILSHTGQDGAALLGVILAFLGGELALLFGRDIVKRGDKNDED